MNPYSDNPRPDIPAWHARAECGRLDNTGKPIHDPAWWFPTGDAADAARLRTRARKVCVGCPVAQECFAQGLAESEPWGVYGGVDFGWARHRVRNSERHWETEARKMRRDVELDANEAARRKAANDAWAAISRGAR